MQTMSAVQAAHILLLEKVKTASLLVDATAGNGGDTLFLAANSPAAARLYAFDVQAEALAATKAKLADAGLLAKAELIQDSHSNIDSYIKEPLDAAIFNLGYLPGAAHELTTTWPSTQAAVHKTLALLRLNGVLVITAYPGHAAGRLEQQKLEEMFQQLDKSSFVAAKYQMINHAANAPLCYIAERVK